MKPRLLLSNDDGITSPFLPIFSKALSQVADVEIVVPASEQSWIGRAYSRHSELAVKKIDNFGVPCRTVSGTPSDCVNIALAHLCKTPPDAVVSGLNIGQNTAYPLLWSSGTFAAAAEGAGWGFPAFAFSMRLEKRFYEQCRLRHVIDSCELQKNVEEASEHAAEFVIEMLAKRDNLDGKVVNVNYPVRYSRSAAFEKSIPANAKMASLYVKNERGGYDFAYAIGETSSPTGDVTDIECLDKGKATYSLIPIRFA